MLFQDITLMHVDVQYVRDVITRFDLISDEKHIVALLRRLTTRMGMDYFRLAIIFPNTIQRPQTVIFNGCPAAWVDIYTKQELFSIDPIVLRGMTQSPPIMWAEEMVRQEIDRKGKGMYVMHLARTMGLKDGITFPWHGANGHVGLLSFITREFRGEHQWLMTVPVLSMISLHIFDAVARVCLSDLSPDDTLSFRELEVCQWAAEGKQTSDIAKILNITPRTVAFHFSNIIRKLGASNKSQAISRAIMQGVVRLNVGRARIENIYE